MGIFVVAMLSAQPTDKLASAKKDKKIAAEKVEGWSHGGAGSLTFNQVGLKNWSAGGDPSISFLLNASYFADLKKGKHLLQNKIFADYGIQKIKGQSFRKNSDRLELFSKYGFQIDKEEKWYFATLVNAKTQFSSTYQYNADNTRKDINGDGSFDVVSKFAAPITLETSLGIDYVPNDKFSLYMSPLAGKFIIVADDEIAALNLHGNDLGKNTNIQLGAMAVASYNHQVHENVNLSSILKIYRAYERSAIANFDIDWQTNIGLKVTKFITASVFLHVIWDWDTDTNLDNNDSTLPNFNPNPDRAVQFKDVIGVGFAYSFKAKTKAEKSAIE